MVSSIFPADAADRMRRRQITKKGFQLCVMVCGRSGTGKSTFVNTLCDGEVYERVMDDDCEEIDEVGDDSTREMVLRSHKVDLGESDGTVISLTIVDTPGFGDNIDNTDCSGKILDYLESQFDEVLIEEARIRRNPKFQDHRVHVCLYFIAANTHGLKELDVELMTLLSSRVNVIPVISKADTMTDEELADTKRQIMADIADHQIPIFSIQSESDDNEALEETMALREMMPFAVVGSNSIYQVGEEYLRGRNYPWGFVRVEDPLHSDFVALRSVLFGSHIQELRDVTQDVIYEKYRTERLCQEPDLMSRLRMESETQSIASTTM